MAKCMYPYEVERKLYFSQTERTVPVPCGKCPECLKRRTASWSHRLEIESLQWSHQHFITLTYDNDHCPISDNNFMTLEPTHVTNFLKRLRKEIGSLCYYMCGEYGTQGKRPHYHMILFTNTVCYANIDRLWHYGDTHYGKVESASIRYTVQYYDKGEWRPSHQRDDRIPEYSRMSKGIGQNMLSLSMVKHFFDHPEKGFIYNNDGHKIAIPSYYKRRLYDYLLPEALVLYNPSILVHMDEIAERKQRHHEAIASIMQEEVTEPDTFQQHESRRMAIENYKRSKRKTRN